MAKYRFHFNPETLQYEYRKEPLSRRLVRISLVFLASSALGLVLMLVYSTVFNTPKTKALDKKSRDLLLQTNLLQEQVNSAAQQIAIIEQRDNNIYRTIFEADSIPSTVRKGGKGGADRYEHYENLKHSNPIKSLAISLDQLAWRAYVQSKSFDNVITMAHEKDRLMHSIPAIQPVAVRQLTRISSLFGIRRDPYTKQGRMHTGVDFVGATGTPIHSAGDGIVYVATYSSTGYGNQVIIDHGFGYKTRYAHLHRISVNEGEKVKRGQIIGTMGNSGRSTGTHLHYEVLVKNKPVNPLNYFNDMSEDEYERMLSQAVIEELD